MKIIIAILSVVMLTSVDNVRAQQDDISFLKYRLENNYAGYKDVVKGNEFNQFVKKLIKEENQDTFRILSRMVSYFDNPHLRLVKPASTSGIAIDSIQCEKNKKNFEKFIRSKVAIRDPREGYWINDKNTVVVALKKVQHTPAVFHAYLVETRTEALFPKGFTIIKMEQKKTGRFETDFVTPRGGMRAFLSSRFKNDSIFTTGDLGKWRRLDDSVTFPLLSKYPLGSYAISGHSLDSTTYVLTISDFSAGNMPVIDSIVKRDKELIARSQNLILDIRDNAGGTVRAYWPIVPYVYTKPYANISSYTLGSKEYADYLKAALEKRLKAQPVDSFIVKYLEEEIKRIDENIGKLVLRPADTFKLDSTSALPKNVGIIINYAVESAGEMMVLDFKHSSKVTIFGENTMGAVDYLNTFNTLLPSGKYSLTVATAKRYIPPGETAVDNIGIKPDVPIADSVSDWVNYVKDYFNGTD